jgi:hypothetical protein
VQASSPAHPNDAPVPEDPRSTLGLGTGDTATPTDAAPERAGNDSPSIEVPGTRDVQAERRTATKPRAATVKRPPSSRAHPQATPSRRADPGAVATTRLIERDLGRFLAK